MLRVFCGVTRRQVIVMHTCRIVNIVAAKILRFYISDIFATLDREVNSNRFARRGVKVSNGR